MLLVGIEPDGMEGTFRGASTAEANTSSAPPRRTEEPLLDSLLRLWRVCGGDAARVVEVAARMHGLPHDTVAEVLSLVLAARDLTASSAVPPASQTHSEPGRRGGFWGTQPLRTSVVPDSAPPAIARTARAGIGPNPDDSLGRFMRLHAAADEHAAASGAPSTLRNRAGLAGSKSDGALLATSGRTQREPQPWGQPPQPQPQQQQQPQMLQLRSPPPQPHHHHHHHQQHHQHHHHHHLQQLQPQPQQRPQPPQQQPPEVPAWQQRQQHDRRADLDTDLDERQRQLQRRQRALQQQQRQQRLLLLQEEEEALMHEGRDLLLLQEEQRRAALQGAAWPHRAGRRAGGVGSGVGGGGVGGGCGGCGVGGGGVGGGGGGCSVGGGGGGGGGITAVVERGDESSWDDAPSPQHQHASPPPPHHQHASLSYSLRGFSPPPPPQPLPQYPHPHPPPPPAQQNRIAVAQGRHQQTGSLQARGPWRAAAAPPGVGEEEQLVYDHKRGWRKRGRWRQPPQMLVYT